MATAEAARSGPSPSARPRNAVAYFSMEVAVADELPTYSGGLGVLAGDHLRAAADLGLPMVGVTLLYRDGYFHQQLDAAGGQREVPVRWEPERALEPMVPRVTVTVSGRPVSVVAWRVRLRGASGAELPLYLLDTALDDNVPEDRTLAAQLYGGDRRHRLRQEALLGLAGPPLLASLGHGRDLTFHMNEGHSSLLTLALLRQRDDDATATAPVSAPAAAVRDRCVFTTHTPVPAGHDRFDLALVEEVLGAEALAPLEALGGLEEGMLNMSTLGMRSSRFVNAVSLRHAHVSRRMFPQCDIEAVTNGVHAATWVSPPFRSLFDARLPGWRTDNVSLHAALDLELADVRAAHAAAKASLVAEVAARTGRSLDPSVLTIAVARRATAYKRTDLIVSDVGRLERLAAEVGPVQLVFSGKAHPQDEGGKELIRRVVAVGGELGDALPVVYLPDYSMDLGRLLCAGSDLWLNTPEKPNEASGTSGMKAALNGVPSLSILDGWWLEGHIEGVTGWAIGDGDPDSPSADDAEAIYRALECTIVPLFYGDPQGFAQVMRSAIALNGSYFTTERMVRQYARRAYWPDRPLAG